MVRLCPNSRFGADGLAKVASGTGRERGVEDVDAADEIDGTVRVEPTVGQAVHGAFVMPTQPSAIS